jgi:hypothetical protein
MPSNQGLYFTLCKIPLAVNIFNIDRICLENSHSNEIETPRIKLTYPIENIS